MARNVSDAGLKLQFVFLHIYAIVFFSFLLFNMAAHVSYMDLRDDCLKTRTCFDYRSLQSLPHAVQLPVTRSFSVCICPQC